jgi:hypothetical protein
MMASFVATTMKVGFSRHAAWLTGAVRASPQKMMRP